jgi:hypothetical protein
MYTCGWLTGEAHVATTEAVPSPKFQVQVKGAVPPVMVAMKVVFPTIVVVGPKFTVNAATPVTGTVWLGETEETPLVSVIVRPATKFMFVAVL